MSVQKILIDFTEYQRLLNCEKELGIAKQKLIENHQYGSGEESTKDIAKLIMVDENGGNSQNIISPITAPGNLLRMCF